MSTSGVVLILIMFFSFALLFSLKSKLAFDTKIGRWSIFVFALIALGYFIGVRYVYDVMKCAQEFHNGPDSRWRDIYLSKVLLLDMCPLMAVLMPLSIIFSKKKVFAKVIAPITIIGAVVTIFGSCIWDNVSPSHFAKYLFVGDDNNRAYFMMHFLSMFLAVWVIMETNKYSFKNMIQTFGFYCLWLIYICLTSHYLKIDWNVTGFVPNDWFDPLGEYHNMYLLWKLPFKYIVIFWYAIGFACNILIIHIKNRSLARAKRKDAKRVEFQKRNDYSLATIYHESDNAQYKQYFSESYEAPTPIAEVEINNS